MQLQFRRLDEPAVQTRWPRAEQPAPVRSTTYYLPMPGERRAAVPPEPAAPRARDDEALSPREIEILMLLSKGCKQAEIAGVLGISVHTVGSHLKNIYRKLDVHSSLQAVFEARQSGMLKA